MKKEKNTLSEQPKKLSRTAKIIIGFAVLTVISSMCSDGGDTADESANGTVADSSVTTTEPESTPTEPESVPAETVEPVEPEPTQSEYDMSMYTHIPKADDFNTAKSKARDEALTYFETNATGSSEFIDEVLIDGSEASDEITVILTINKNHELLQGQVDALRNVAVGLVQDAGLVKTDDTLRKVVVKISWNYETYTYTFTYGDGWSE